MSCHEGSDVALALTRLVAYPQGLEFHIVALARNPQESRWYVSTRSIRRRDGLLVQFGIDSRAEDDAVDFDVLSQTIDGMSIVRHMWVSPLPDVAFKNHRRMAGPRN